MHFKKSTIQFVLLKVGIIVPLFLLSACSLVIFPVPDSVDVEVENAINRGFDGIIVYVDQPENERLFAAGYANRENQIPADPHRLFKIASISKLYIAAACAKLVHVNVLSLDKTLGEYLPDLVNRIENADEITLRMMLQHRSGIPNFTDDPDYPWDNPFKDNRQTLELVLDEPADFAPDKKYKYSNTNYLLIGEILDNVLGYSHHDYIKSEILNPLGLNNTYSLLSEVDLDSVMSGYYAGYEYDIKENDFVQPGGSMVATAEDVGKFLRALIDGSLFTEDEQSIYSSIYEYEHTGLLPGYQSMVRYHEDIDAVVVQFTNTSGGNFWNKSENVYNRIIKILGRE
ncbi:MAG: beta-lactamase family protein [Bacteroidetes bacterium]|nr:beta-lactamase family protein [Bacteroidota bacterium]